MRRTLILLLFVLATGCSQATQPLRSHGQTVEHWLAVLHDRDPLQRKKAVTALGHVSTADPAALPAVIDALHDSDRRVRAEAALALLNIGPAAREAVPALETATGDADPTVRSYAQKALERVRGE